MGYQPLEDLLPKADGSVYKLVRIAAKRALEISETGAKLVTVAADTKLTTVALEEIREGKVLEKETAQRLEPQAASKKK